MVRPRRRTSGGHDVVLEIDAELRDELGGRRPGRSMVVDRADHFLSVIRPSGGAGAGIRLRVDSGVKTQF